MDEVRVAGTRIVWRGLRGWLDAVARLNAGAIRASAPNYRRARSLMDSLQEDHVRECDDAEALADFEAFMRQSRHGAAGLWLDPTRNLDRAGIGVFIVLAANRHRTLAAGRPTREKGPRFDPARLPAARLDHLIQSHPDLEIVARLREERRRRAGTPRCVEASKAL
jgi:hypothetical protein